jgi:hypothetical protein
MDILHKSFEKHLLKLAKQRRLDLDLIKIDDSIERAINTVIPRAVSAISKTLKKKAPQMLRKKRVGDSAFQKRNLKRWQKGFDALEVLLVSAGEFGSDFNSDYRAEAVAKNDLVFEALTAIHARALLVGNEIITLMKGGFADGALARWRTLHELAVVACFVSTHDNSIANRYLLAYRVQASKAMRQYQEYADRAGLDRYSSEEIKKSEEQRNRILAEFGDEMRNEYGWAAPILGNKNPTLHDIEKSVGLDHWRPRYKWAAHYSHANFKPPSTLLGMSEASEPMLLIGPSNSGMTDPAHMTALSITQSTASLLLTKQTIDHILAVEILRKLSDDVGNNFFSVEKSMLSTGSGTIKKHRN